MALIELQNVCKEFTQDDLKIQALDNINLSIEENDIYGIIGMSGAGKSTLVRCLNFLEKPTSGTVVIDGEKLSSLTEKELREKRGSIAMIFQHLNLLMQKTVIDNVIFPLKLKGVKKSEAKEKAMEYLKTVGLEDKAKAYPAQLSGGQKQRVAIAGILALEPKCIVLDEPTAMLDPQGRKEIMTTVKNLNKEKKITIVYITHYMEEAMQADRVIVMGEGKIQFAGTPREVFCRVEELEAWGLEAPLAAKVASELRRCGAKLPKEIVTEEELAQALCQ